MKRTFIASVAVAAFLAPLPAQAQSDTDAKAGVKFLEQQQAEETLASRMMGLTVQSPSGEELGDVNDLVIGPDGNISGAVIGVGGFLGIAEKNIAVSYDSIEMQTSDGNTVVVLAASKDELKAAPDYRDADEKPLSVSKRLADEAKETYKSAKEKASETYKSAKEKAAETYNKAKDKVSGEEAEPANQ